MGYGLCVSGDSIVFCGGEVDVSRAEAGEDLFDFIEALLGGSVFDYDLKQLVSIVAYDEVPGIPEADHEDRRLGHGGSGSRQSQHLLGDASRKQQFPEPCKRSDHQQ